MDRGQSARAVVIVFMGDSITAGQYVQAELCWTSIVADAILRRYLSTAINFHILSRGVSGETTRQGLERFPADVQQHRPDIVTLQFGLNDCNCWVTDGGLPRVSGGAYRANLIEMVMRARHFGARRIILSTNHPTLRRKILLGGESLEDRRRRYNDHVRDVAALTSVELCDIEEAFAGYDDSRLSELLLPYPDLLHLSAAGHRCYADRIQPFVERAAAEIVSSQEPINAQKLY